MTWLTFILHHLIHPFIKNECEMNNPRTSCLNLETIFTNYELNVFWIGHRLKRLLNNITKVNVILEEGENGKGMKVVSNGEVPHIPKPILGGSLQVQSETSRGTRNASDRGFKANLILSLAPFLKNKTCPHCIIVDQDLIGVQREDQGLLESWKILHF